MLDECVTDGGVHRLQQAGRAAFEGDPHVAGPPPEQ